MPNTSPDPVAQAAHSRELYETQLRLNGRLVDDIAACKEAFAKQATELDGLRDRDEAFASLAEANNELLKLWGERLATLEDILIASLEDSEREAAVRQTLPNRDRDFRLQRSAAHLAARMGPSKA